MFKTVTKQEPTNHYKHANNRNVHTMTNIATNMWTYWRQTEIMRQTLSSLLITYYVKLDKLLRYNTPDHKTPFVSQGF